MRKVLLLLCVLSSTSAAQQSPGVAVLERMRKAYEGRWYNTLTFVQRTIT